LFHLAATSEVHPSWVFPAAQVHDLSTAQPLMMFVPLAEVSPEQHRTEA
jgi:hypothetical protein